MYVICWDSLQLLSCQCLLPHPAHLGFWPSWLCKFPTRCRSGTVQEYPVKVRTAVLIFKHRHKQSQSVVTVERKYKLWWNLLGYLKLLKLLDDVGFGDVMIFNSNTVTWSPNLVEKRFHLRRSNTQQNQNNQHRRFG